MRMSFRGSSWVIGLAALLPGASLLGQTDEGPGGAPGGRPERRFGRGEGRMAPRDPVAALQQLRTAVGEKLQLTDVQLAVINPLFDAHQRELEALRPELDRQREQNAAQVRELREQMRAAQDDGDREKAREIGQKLQAMMAPPAALKESNERFASAVKQQLTDDQRPVFERLSQQVSNPPRPGGEVFAIMGALRDLQLTDAQRDKIDEIQQKHRGVMRQASSEGPEAVEALAKQFRAEVVAELTPEQKTQFDAAVERLKSEAPGQGRGPGGRRRPSDNDK